MSILIYHQLKPSLFRYKTCQIDGFFLYKTNDNYLMINIGKSYFGTNNIDITPLNHFIRRIQKSGQISFSLFILLMNLYLLSILVPHSSYHYLCISKTNILESISSRFSTTNSTNLLEFHLVNLKSSISQIHP
jgi:hypothetical protein